MMEKTQWFSERYSSGFVPEYRRAVETVGESEGFGSSARADSEYSSAPKRKCIGLNVDRHNVFNVPTQFLSLSHMSKSQRKEAEMTLRGELEQLQMWQRKILAGNAQGMDKGALSSSVSGQLKKHIIVSQNNANLKQGNIGKSESVKQVSKRPQVLSKNNALLLKQCETLLKHMLGHKFSWVFKNPVDIVKLKIPDYFQVIKHPMDLGTIGRRLNSGSYSSPWSFASDVRLTFTNAMTYNPPGHNVHFMADTLSKLFETRWKPIERKLVAADVIKNKQTENLKSFVQTEKRKATSVCNDAIRPDILKPKMTEEEKLDLGRHLESVGEIPDIFVDFFRRNTCNLNQTGVDEIEIDIDSLSDVTLFELKKLLEEYSQRRQVQACEVETLNESGLSSSSMHACKVNEEADEDVDIVGNDHPDSFYPPIVIHKDAVLRSSKSSSSSSSSSVSDSVSNGSSRAESDVKVPPQKDNKESLSSRTAFNKEINEMLTPIDRNRHSDALDPLEHNAYPKPVSVKADCSKEGENAPSERQVSPEKHYRAALLRNRFADTILKAREKTLDQVEKRNPEKSRQEREKLERQQREEKARLQAEAKAAEEARRQAKAAEAKHKRELERETARQALLQIERTVELNESNMFLKDIEMLRTDTGDHFPSSVGETSLTHLQEGIGSFRIGGGNPLEQLGLYMKVDEEEEVEPYGVCMNEGR